MSTEKPTMSVALALVLGLFIGNSVDGVIVLLTAAFVAAVAVLLLAAYGAVEAIRSRQRPNRGDRL